MIEAYPHTYLAGASATLTGVVHVTAAGVGALASAPAPQFGGPDGFWSPETLLTAAIADCYIFTFRAVSGAARFGWLALGCQVEGIVQKIDRTPRFATLAIRATLTVAPGADAARARRLLRQADRACLIANSLKADRTHASRVIVAAAADTQPRSGAGEPGTPPP